MQTFLPHSGFDLSAQRLDRMRLGKQRVECKQIYFALTRPEYGWKNHPATKMWRGYESALLNYSISICLEWINRGYKDAQLSFFRTELAQRRDDPIVFPPWLGNEQFHLSHRSNLLRKMPQHYRTYWPDDPDDLDYVWPV